MGFWDALKQASDNISSEIFKGATGLDPRNANDQVEIKRRMEAARQVKEAQRQHEIEQVFGTKGKGK